MDIAVALEPKIAPQRVNTSAVNFNSVEFSRLVQEMRKEPKDELHLHLGGSWPLMVLQKHAEPALYAELVHLLQCYQESVDYHEGFKVFGLMEKIMDTDEKVSQGVTALLGELAADKVTYVEIRTGLKDLGSGLEGYLQSVLAGMKQGVEWFAIEAKLILSVRRNTPKEIVKTTIDLALKYGAQGIVGLDVSGDSTTGDSATIIPLLQEATRRGLPITLHIGESREETPKQQMHELEGIKPARVGHAALLCEEAEAWIKKHRITVELCLTSAAVVGMVASIEQHPALKLLKEGHPVKICTDDPTVFGVTLSEEWAKVALLTGLSKEELIKTQKWS